MHGVVVSRVPVAAAADSLSDADDRTVVLRLAVALAAGLLVGLQRQFAGRDETDDLFAGARSFALISLVGAATTLLSAQFGSVVPLALGFAAVAVVAAVGYAFGARAGSMGTTTELAALVTFAAGAFIADGRYTIGGALAVTTTALLAAKPYTSELVDRIDRADVEATIQFAVLAVLVLPILPRDPLGPAPFDAASPFKVGLMVVFILGLSFLGYVLIKFVGPERGIGLTGILGGLVSSTAVTLTMSERAKSSAGLVRALAMAVLLAWTIMYGRVIVEIGVVNAELLSETLVPIGAGGAVVAGWALLIARRRGGSAAADEGGEDDAEQFSNPFSLKPAIQFGLLYGVVLIGSKALSMYLGEAGVYIGAIASGLTDVDAITLSMAELSRGQGELADETAANAIVLAAASNTLVKGGLVWSLSTPPMRKLVTPAVIGAVVVSVALTFAI